MVGWMRWRRSRAFRHNRDTAVRQEMKGANQSRRRWQPDECARAWSGILRHSRKSRPRIHRGCRVFGELGKAVKCRLGGPRYR